MTKQMENDLKDRTEVLEGMDDYMDEYEGIKGIDRQTNEYLDSRKSRETDDYRIRLTFEGQMDEWMNEQEVWKDAEKDETR